MVLSFLIYGAITASIRKSATLISKLSRTLLRIVGVGVVCRNPLPSSRKIIFANHQGWLDGVVLASLLPARFVGKSELKSIPIIGRLLKRLGCLFVNRGIPLEKQPALVSDVLSSERSVVVFPEGTTNASPGKLKLGFINFSEVNHLPAIVVSLKYTPQEPALYVGKETLLSSTLKLLRCEYLVVCEVEWKELSLTDRELQISEYFSTL